MTKEQLREMIGDTVEEKLRELLGDPDEGLALRRVLRARLLRQRREFPVASLQAAVTEKDLGALRAWRLFGCERDVSGNRL